LAEGDKLRLQKQMAEREKKGYFLLDDKSKSTDPANAKLFKKTKSQNDLEGGGGVEEAEDLQPKRALSAFMFFSIEYGQKMRAKNSELAVGDVAKLVGEKWGTLSDKEKEPYEKLNAQDKERLKA
jgi:hypothetical protein